MGASGNWLIIQRIVTTMLYKLLRLVFITLQSIFWQLNGTARKIREARLPHNYERSAQVLDVLLVHKFCRGQLITVDNFLCTHNRFEHPQYIIDNDNITLMTINEHDAVFCEPAQKDMHLWRSDYGLFIRKAQTDFCRRLIVVPLSTFHRLAQLIGDPKGELIFLFISARCGSTLLTQIMEYTGRCVALSEPNSPSVVAIKYRKFGDSSELRQLARDVIRWECRPYPTIQPPPLGYFLKFRSPCITALPLLKYLFPSSKCLFMYRDVVPVAKSIHRLSMVIPTLRIVDLLGSFSGQLKKMIVESRGGDGSHFCVRLDNELTHGVLCYAMATSTYLDMRRRGFDISALRYEDLVARPLDMCRVILEYCHLPVSLAELAVKTFDVDSHRNSVSAKSVLGRMKEPQLTPEKKAKLNELLKKYGLPLIGEPNFVEGTLSCLKSVMGN